MSTFMPKENSETSTHSICRIIRISNCVKISLHRGDSCQYQSFFFWNWSCHYDVWPIWCVVNHFIRQSNEIWHIFPFSGNILALPSNSSASKGIICDITLHLKIDSIFNMMHGSIWCMVTTFLHLSLFDMWPPYDVWSNLLCGGHFCT